LRGVVVTGECCTPQPSADARGAAANVGGGGVRDGGHGEIAGTITLVYDHHKQHVQATLTDIQHDHHEVIISTMHVHLDHHNCLEVLVVRGRASLIKKIADELIGAKGVKHGKLTVTTTGKELPA
jgi:CopG family nickel-responsive transcriptional regulator